jgi:hypothetical protein
MRWEVLLDEARRRRLETGILHALRFIRREYAAPVPEAVLAALSRGARSPLTRLELAARSRPPGILPGFFLHWCDLGELRRDLPTARRLRMFPDYLRHLWGLDRIGQVPLAALRKSAVRIAARLQRG